MNSNSAQLDMALWMLSDLSNSFFSRKLQDKVREQTDEIHLDPRNSFSICEMILAATELYFENDGISNWFYNSVGEWLDDVNELWLSDPDYYWAKVLRRSRKGYKSQVSFVIGKIGEDIGDIPKSAEQFKTSVLTKQIRFFRSQ